MLYHIMYYSIVELIGFSVKKKKKRDSMNVTLLIAFIVFFPSWQYILELENLTSFWDSCITYLQYRHLK